MKRGEQNNLGQDMRDNNIRNIHEGYQEEYLNPYKVDIVNIQCVIEYILQDVVCPKAQNGSGQSKIQ